MSGGVSQMPSDIPSQGFAARLVRLFFSREFVRFLISGGLAAVVNFAVGFSIRAAFGAKTHAVSVLVGFIVGTVVSFYMNRHYTFRANAEPVPKQAVKYALAAVLGIAFAVGAAELLLLVGTRLAHGALSDQMLGHITHVISIGLATLLNFLTVKFFALRTTPRS